MSYFQKLLAVKPVSVLVRYSVIPAFFPLSAMASRLFGNLFQTPNDDGDWRLEDWSGVAWWHGVESGEWVLAHLAVGDEVSRLETSMSMQGANLNYLNIAASDHLARVDYLEEEVCGLREELRELRDAFHTLVHEIRELRLPPPPPAKSPPVLPKGPPVKGAPPSKAIPVTPKAAPLPSKAPPVPPKAAPLPSKAPPVLPKAAPIPSKAQPFPLAETGFFPKAPPAFAVPQVAFPLRARVAAPLAAAPPHPYQPQPTQVVCDCRNGQTVQLSHMRNQ